MVIKNFIIRSPELGMCVAMMPNIYGGLCPIFAREPKELMDPRLFNGIRYLPTFEDKYKEKYVELWKERYHPNDTFEFIENENGSIVNLWKEGFEYIEEILPFFHCHNVKAI